MSHCGVGGGVGAERSVSLRKTAWWAKAGRLPNKAREHDDLRRCTGTKCACTYLADSASRLPGSVSGPGPCRDRAQVEISWGQIRLPGSFPLLNRVANSPEASSHGNSLPSSWAVQGSPLMRDTWETWVPQTACISSQNRAKLVWLKRPSLSCIRRAVRGTAGPGRWPAGRGQPMSTQS